MSQNPVDIPASVSLDGTILRQLREEKRLTQLYVSKVVGVTTDTISRWENNRYPTMRRENALKLAEALEVPVEVLLRKPEEVAEPPPPAPGRKAWLVAAVLGGVLTVALLVLVLHRGRAPAPPLAIAAERRLPPYAAPGSAIPVMVRLVQNGESGGFILRESLPKGWKLLQAHPPASSLDNERGVARWIVKPGDRRERIVYLAQVGGESPIGSSGTFRGELVRGPGGDKAATVVAGDERVTVAPVLWADLNGDGRIDDSEMLEASYAVDEMAGVHIDWQELESLWSAGGYRWDGARGRFVPRLLRE